MCVKMVKWLVKDKKSMVETVKLEVKLEMNLAEVGSEQDSGTSKIGYRNGEIVGGKDCEGGKVVGERH